MLRNRDWTRAKGIDSSGAAGRRRNPASRATIAKIHPLQDDACGRPFGQGGRCRRAGRAEQLDARSVSWLDRYRSDARENQSV